MRAEDIGSWLYVPTGQVIRYTRQGLLPCLTLPSGELLFDPADLVRWLDRCQHTELQEGPSYAR
jgi:hypothetical protein